jgi:hypothetical protein
VVLEEIADASSGLCSTRSSSSFPRSVLPSANEMSIAPSAADTSRRDDVLHPGRVKEDLDRSDTLAIDRGNESLRDDRPERQRQLHEDLCVLLSREEVHDAFQPDLFADLHHRHLPFLSF